MAAVDPTVLERLGAALRNGPRLRLAILFGSRAVGRERPDSDFDIGVIPKDPSLALHEELALAAALSSAADAEVDLVRLDGEDLLLGREVAQTGVCLLEDSPGVFAAYRATAMSRWMDWDETLAPHRANFLRRLARALP
jgi:predicted nucleotidyltransferase